jgi:hypothetical protein
MNIQHYLLIIYYLLSYFLLYVGLLYICLIMLANNVNEIGGVLCIVFWDLGSLILQLRNISG